MLKLFVASALTLAGVVVAAALGSVGPSSLDPRVAAYARGATRLDRRGRLEAVRYVKTTNVVYWLGMVRTVAPL